MNRRQAIATALKSIGLFTILPGAGRLWKAQRPPTTDIPINYTSPEELQRIFSEFWLQPHPLFRCHDDLYLQHIANILKNFPPTKQNLLNIIHS